MSTKSLTTITLKDKLKPRSQNQKLLLQTFCEKDLVLVWGCWGSGKSVCSIGWACEQLIVGNCEKIVLCKAVSHLNDVLGFQKGSQTEKIAVYFAQEEQYLIKFFGIQQYEKLVKDKTIELLPMGLLRGRSLDKAICISEESQNSSKQELITLLTRIGRDSKLFILADPDQTDVPESCYFERLFTQIDDSEIGKVKLEESDCFRHKHLVRWHKKFKEIL